MKSEGPYFHRLMVNGMCGSPCEACSYAEGRKSMEKYAEESINLGRAESIVLNKEIRRLEKLFEEREQEIQDLRFAIGESDKDFKELLDLANQFDAEAPYKDPTSFEFGAWKKARGIE